MAGRNQKLPDRPVLIQHLRDGMDRNAIAERYDVQASSVRQRFAYLDLFGIEAEIRRQRQQAEVATMPPGPTRPGIYIMPGKLVRTREVAAGDLGGTACRSVSLPLILFQVAALREAGSVTDMREAANV